MRGLTLALVGAGAAAAAALVCARARRRRRAQHAAQQLRAPTLHIIGFKPGDGVPDFSPFATKLCAFCRLAGIEYKYISVLDLDGSIAPPKQKVPAAFGGPLGARVVGDSLFIARELRASGCVPAELDGWLTDEQAAIAHMVATTLEESGYWGLLNVRWKSSPRNIQATLDAYFDGLPAFKLLGRRVIQPQLVASMHAQGTGRHSDAEITAKVAAEVRSVAAILGSKPYLMGDKPCSADAAVFAFASAFLAPGWQHPLLDEVRACPNLVEYVDRLRSELFGTDELESPPRPAGKRRL